MFNKVGPKALLILIAVLGVIWAVSELTSISAKPRTFREYVWQVDTAKVTAFSVRPHVMHGEEMLFQRKGDHWRVTNKGTDYSVDQKAVDRLFDMCRELKVERVLGSVRTLKDYYSLSDTAASHLTLAMGTDTLHLIVGRSAYDPQGTGTWTYVQVPGDTTIYAVDKLLVTSIDQGIEVWRTRTLVSGDPKNWLKVEFIYPMDSGYTFLRNDTGWTVNNIPGDTTKIENFLKSVGQSIAQQFADGADLTGARPLYTLRIEDTSRSEPITVQCFGTATGYVIMSSQNPENVMRFDAEREVPRLFRPMAKWFP